MDNEELPYRSPATAPGPDPVTDKDDEDLPTLLSVKKTLDEAITALYKDFNAFKILATDNKTEATEKLLIKILGKQEAYDILSPLQSTIESAIEAVKQKHEG